MYVVNNRSLAGGDTVKIAPGRYAETLTLTTADDGTSDSSRVVFEGAGAGLTIIEGLSTTRIVDASCVQCTAAANCNSNSQAYLNVYRCPNAPSGIKTVYETNWVKGRIIIDDRATGSTPIGLTGSTGQCDVSSCTNTVFEPTYPYPYHKVTNGVPGVNRLPGSWYQSGTNLFVRTFGGPPSALIDIEAAVRTEALYVNGSTAAPIRFVTFKNMTFRYGGDTCVWLENASDMRLEAVEGYSCLGSVVSVYGTDNLVITNFKFASAHDRGAAWNAPTSDVGFGNGWIFHGEGWVLAVRPSFTDTTSGALIENGEIFDGWNVAGFEGTVNSTFRNILIKNGPNHVWAPNGMDPQSSNVRMERLITFNGQESTYGAGCRNCYFLRQATAIHLLDDDNSVQSDGAKLYSNLLNSESDVPGYDAGGVEVCSACMPGFKADYNWHAANDDRCAWGGTRYSCRDDGSGTDWPDVCNCDQHQVSTTNTVQLSGTIWPLKNGLAASLLTRLDFLPVAGSPLIDAGNPDIDADGVLETSCSPVRQDDCCDAANYCFGARPDIGPFEFGIVEGGATPLVGPPSNLRRTDRP